MSEGQKFKVVSSNDIEAFAKALGVDLEESRRRNAEFEASPRWQRFLYLRAREDDGSITSEEKEELDARLSRHDPIELSDGSEVSFDDGPPDERESREELRERWERRLKKDPNLQG